MQAIVSEPEPLFSQIAKKFQNFSEERSKFCAFLFCLVFWYPVYLRQASSLSFGLRGTNCLQGQPELKLNFGIHSISFQFHPFSYFLKETSCINFTSKFLELGLWVTILLGRLILENNTNRFGVRFSL